MQRCYHVTVGTHQFTIVASGWYDVLGQLRDKITLKEFETLDGEPDSYEASGTHAVITRGPRIR